MKTLGEIIERNAACHPDKEGIVFADKRVRFADYAVRCQQLAASLYAEGVRRSDRVAVLSMNRVEILEVYGACELSGFLPCPINFRLASEEIAYILADSAPAVLLFEDQYAPMIEALRPRFPNIRLFISIGTPVAGTIAYEDFLASGAQRSTPIRSRPSDYAHLIYTSGTTGRPKGAVRTHANAIGYSQLLATNCEMTFDGRALLVTPLFHIGAKSQQFAQHWLGGTIVVHRQFDPRAVLEAMQNERITFMTLVPTIVQALIDVPTVKSFDLSSIRVLNTSGAPITPVLLQRAIEVFGRVFMQQYGMTEGLATVMFSSEMRPNGSADDVKRIGSVGHAMIGVEVRVVDEHDNDCPIGVVGEVLNRSPALFDHYWNNSAATLEAMRDGWYHSGDMGYFDEKNYLYLVDRKKDMIISGGENIYSREVEIALARHPNVKDAAVIGIPDPYWGETVRAIVAAVPGTTPSEPELIEHCRSLIAHYKCPKSVIFVEALPVLPTGKVNKVLLREQHGQRAKLSKDSKSTQPVR